MRYINNTGNIPKSYLKTAQIELLNLKKLSTIQEKKEYLDIPQNKKWNEIKPHFERIGNHKCWFTESGTAISDLYIEHFRPKKTVHLIRNKHTYPEARATTDASGYWWLSYEYSNLRLVGAKPNQKKGNYFPLVNGSRIAVNENFNTKIERPVLLDPCIENDVKLLAFDGTVARPANPDSNHIECQRAEVSIIIYDLNSSRLKKARARVYEELKNYFELAELNYTNITNAGLSSDAITIARETFVKVCTNIVSMLQPRNQFTSMVKSFLEAQNLAWIEHYILYEAKARKYI